MSALAALCSLWERKLWGCERLFVMYVIMYFHSLIVIFTTNWDFHVLQNNLLNELTSGYIMCWRSYICFFSIEWNSEGSNDVLHAFWEPCSALRRLHDFMGNKTQQKTYKPCAMGFVRVHWDQLKGIWPSALWWLLSHSEHLRSHSVNKNTPLLHLWLHEKHSHLESCCHACYQPRPAQRSHGRRMRDRPFAYTVTRGVSLHETRIGAPYPQGAL